jgi:hypothetical protein
MSEDDTPDPEEVQDQMRSAIERIRAKLAEPESSGGPPKGKADEHPK